MEQRHLRDFFTHEQKDAILAAVHHAEMRTSGHIRVRLDKRAGDDVRGAARRAFDALGLRGSHHRNGILFYLAVEDRKFVILGDDAIYHKLPPHFWDAITARIIAQFREGRYAEGLIEGIEWAGEHLAAWFPHRPDDGDVPPDEISVDDD